VRCGYVRTARTLILPDFTLTSFVLSSPLLELRKTATWYLFDGVCFYLSTPFVTVRSDTSTLPLISSFTLVRPVIIYTISCESPRLMFPVSPRVNLSHTRYRPHRRRRHLCAKPASRNFHGLHLEVSLHTQTHTLGQIRKPENSFQNNFLAKAMTTSSLHTEVALG
jgi:hypothetical protein